MRQWFQGYMTPPQLNGTRKLVVEAMKMAEPTQSTRFSCDRNGLRWKCRRRKSGIMAKARPQKGRLIQKIHRHDTFCAKAPPRIGPLTAPIAHCRLIRPNHFPRSRSVTRSVTMTYVSAMIPPPPTPWIDRPSRRTVKVLARLQTMAPMVKSINAARIRGLRPKMCENRAQVG